MLKLITPEPSYIPSYYEGCVCTWGRTHNNYIISDPSKYDAWRNNLLDSYANQAKGIGLPEGYLPNVTLWLIDDLKHEYVGSVNIRLGINDVLRDYGGQVGFVVRADMRGQGYGHVICNLAVKEAHRLGFNPVLLTCICDNISSYRILLKTDYISKEECFTTADGCYCKVAKFLI